MDLNLRNRIITAGVLVPVMIAAVIALPSAAFSVVVGVFAVLGGWEWARLMGWSRTRGRVTYALALALVLALLYPALSIPGVVGLVLGAAAAWWCLALTWVAGTQRGRPPPALDRRWAGWLAGWLTLVPAWSGLVYLHGIGSRGPYLVLALLGLIWAADIAAFFTGRRYGRHRLASRVSPGKSWEGVLGGVVAALGLGVAIVVVTGDAYASPVVVVGLCVMTSLVSVLGDLTQSMLKRRVGLQDSGRLIPGHGGVLDRIDSLTSAAPWFALGIMLLTSLR